MKLGRPTPLNLFFEDLGQGPSVLGATGWTVSDIIEFGSYLPTAISGRRLVTFHYRGSGSSPHLDHPEHSTRAYAADLSRVMDRNAEVDCWDLIGLGGMGACTMMELAIAEPDRVRSVVLHQGWARADTSLRWQLESLAHVRRHAGFEAYQHLAAALCFSPTYLEHSGDAVLSKAWVPIKDVLDTHLGFIEACLNHDVSGRLRNVKAPVLFITGDERDLMTGRRLLDNLTRELPDAQSHVMTNTPHAFNEAPQSAAEFDEVVGDFWSRHSPVQ